MASTDTRILITDSAGNARYLILSVVGNNVLIVDENTSQLMTINLGVSASGNNTGDETLARLYATLGITVLSGDNTGDQIAATVPFTPAGDIVATDVQAMGEELGADVSTILAASYILQTALAALPNAIALADLATGILKNTTATGALSIAVAGDFPTLDQDTTGTAAKATNLKGGNNTTLLGAIGYQSNTDTTTLLGPNTTTTKKYLRQTGTGTNGAPPAWDTISTAEVSDYAVGTFTPVIEGATTAGIGTYTAQTGSYQKIGNRVHFQLHVAWSAHDGTGGIHVTGLPYTALAGGAGVSPCTIISDQLTYSNQLCAYVNYATSYIKVMSMGTGATISAVAIDSAATLWITGSYEL